MAQFTQCLGLNLANALTRDVEHLSDFFERVLISVFKSKSHAYDAFFAGTEFFQHGGHRFAQTEADGRI